MIDVQKSTRTFLFPHPCNIPVAWTSSGQLTTNVGRLYPARLQTDPATNNHLSGYSVYIQILTYDLNIYPAGKTAKYLIVLISQENHPRSYPPIFSKVWK